jgi:hypothetical protein
MTDFSKARELGTSDGNAWATVRATSVLQSTLADEKTAAVAQKQAMFRLVSFLQQTFFDQSTEDVLREALGISATDDLVKAQNEYETAWLEAAKAESLKSHRVL